MFSPKVTTEEQSLILHCLRGDALNTLISEYFVAKDFQFLEKINPSEFSKKYIESIDYDKFINPNGMGFRNADPLINAFAQATNNAHLNIGNKTHADIAKMINDSSAFSFIDNVCRNVLEKQSLFIAKEPSESWTVKRMLETVEAVKVIAIGADSVDLFNYAKKREEFLKGHRRYIQGGMLNPSYVFKSDKCKASKDFLYPESLVLKWQASALSRELNSTLLLPANIGDSGVYWGDVSDVNDRNLTPNKMPMFGNHFNAEIDFALQFIQGCREDGFDIKENLMIKHYLTECLIDYCWSHHVDSGFGKLFNHDLLTDNIDPGSFREYLSVPKPALVESILNLTDPSCWVSDYLCAQKSIFDGTQDKSILLMMKKLKEYHPSLFDCEMRQPTECFNSENRKISLIKIICEEKCKSCFLFLVENGLNTEAEISHANGSKTSIGEYIKSKNMDFFAIANAKAAKNVAESTVNEFRKILGNQH